ncbi:hypothetical protein CYMTET_46312 [Cymbomonas tetramitiformis]|uniref:BACK domain-containing protein n=1 Tax=Cymbomonas tetramitiformis TaxID=36881 RepID=A0AAE0BXQ0_9CHLO|nr:hypothetical protein CYMTET_46312 [Cymbomonas tetramitiformis]
MQDDFIAHLRLIWKTYQLCQSVARSNDIGRECNQQIIKQVYDARVRSSVNGSSNLKLEVLSDDEALIARLSLSCLSMNVEELLSNQVEEKGDGWRLLSTLCNFALGKDFSVETQSLGEALLHAARHQVYWLHEASTEIMVASISAANCFSAFALAERCSSHRLLEGSEDFAKREFDAAVVGNLHSVGELSGPSLYRILACDDLNTSSELNVYKAVAAWVKHDKERRTQDLPRLLASVRMGLMSVADIADHIDSSDLVGKCPESSRLVAKAVISMYCTHKPPPKRRRLSAQCACFEDPEEETRAVPILDGRDAPVDDPPLDHGKLLLHDLEMSAPVGIVVRAKRPAKLHRGLEAAHPVLRPVRAAVYRHSASSTSVLSLM